MKLNWNFHKGGRVQAKKASKASEGGEWTFCGTKHLSEQSMAWVICHTNCKLINLSSGPI